jgi:hypothetical protein
MQQNDAKAERLAAEIMLQMLGMSPKDEMIKGAPESEESLVERIRAIKAQRNTISRQLNKKD